MELNRKNLTKLRELVKIMRDVDNEFPPQQIEALLVLGLKPGANGVAVGEEVGLGSASISRTLANILNRRHGLVRQVPSTEDYRIKNVYLTDKGERFLHRLSEVLNS